MKYWLLSALLLLTALVQGQDLKAYQLYRQDGTPATYGELLQAAQATDVVLFGELHNNSLVHWLQRQLTEDMAESVEDLVLGAEMFERDDQRLLDEYLQGVIRQKDFEKEVKLWPNYATDYQPLVEVAVDNQLPFVATNVPRRYAALVSRQGLSALDSLVPTAKELWATQPFPIDYELPGYASMLDMFAGHGGDMDPKLFVQAQALKDATMAESILRYWEPGKVFLHYHGTFHGKGFEGIGWYLKEAQPEINTVTIHSVEQDSLGTLEEEHLNTATFILVVPSNMAKSYD